MTKKSLDMEGSFLFNEETIDEKVSPNKIGNYALGEKDDEGTFLVSYVGRSDSDLRDELKARSGTHNLPRFKFSYANSKEEAFNKECRNYHDFDPSKNKTHPDSPDGMNLKCPVCG